MKLGILVNTDDHLEEILGVTRAAVDKGHEVEIFVMDRGTRLLEKSEFTALDSVAGVSIGYCDHSAVYMEIDKTGIPEGIAGGTQYGNATMNQDADRVIVL